MEISSSDWLLTDKVASWPGTTAERGWRYLRQALERYDTPKIDFRYTKAVFDTLLLHEMQKSIPTWILQRIQVHPFLSVTRTSLTRFFLATPPRTSHQSLCSVRTI